MKLLVTGGSGYVGAGVLRRTPSNWTIAATYFAHPIERAGVAAFRVDIRDVDAVNRLFAEFCPDVVIHTAARMVGDGMMATNADGSRQIARAATRVHARLIHLSSDVIFDGEHAPYDENATPAPITPYAESKARAEQAVKEEFARSRRRSHSDCNSPGAEGESVQPHPIIVRTSLVYGCTPMDPRTRQTVAGEMPRLFTDEYRCPIFVEDLADALLEIAAETSEVSKPLEVSVLNIAGPQRLNRYEFGIKLARAFGVEPRFQPAFSASSPTPRPRDCTLDISRAQKILRTRLRGIDEVINEWKNE